MILNVFLCMKKFPINWLLYRASTTVRVCFIYYTNQPMYDIFHLSFGHLCTRPCFLSLHYSVVYPNSLTLSTLWRIFGCHPGMGCTAFKIESSQFNPAERTFSHHLWTTWLDLGSRYTENKRKKKKKIKWSYMTNESPSVLRYFLNHYA